MMTPPDRADLVRQIDLLLSRLAQLYLQGDPEVALDLYHQLFALIPPSVRLDLQHDKDEQIGDLLAQVAQLRRQVALPGPQREQLRARLEGMQLAQRICRNRAEDVRDNPSRMMEAEICAESIRLVQVGIGNGSMPFGELTADEQDAIGRIY